LSWSEAGRLRAAGQVWLAVALGEVDDRLFLADRQEFSSCISRTSPGTRGSSTGRSGINVGVVQVVGGMKL